MTYVCILICANNNDNQLRASNQPHVWLFGRPTQGQHANPHTEKVPRGLGLKPSTHGDVKVFVARLTTDGAPSVVSGDPGQGDGRGGGLGDGEAWLVWRH